MKGSIRAWAPSKIHWEARLMIQWALGCWAVFSEKINQLDVVYTIFIYIEPINREREEQKRYNEAKIKQSWCGEWGKNESPSWNRCRISVDPVWVWALVIFSDPLCSLSISGCLNTEDPLLLLRVAAFISGLIWRFPLIPLYGNQPTSNPDHLSQRYTFFVLDRELTWAGLQRAEVALL